MERKFKVILEELEHHAPFTLFGASTGIICMLLFRQLGSEINLKMFQFFHPAHVILSAMVTSSLFLLHKGKKKIIQLLIIGYFGSVGIATLSDCILPFFGESLLGVAIPTHAEQHEAQEAIEEQTAPNAAEHAHEHQGPHIHLGFIEEWYIVNPAAFLGIFIAYFLPRTKFPHAGHVLISTWASSFHVLMNTQREFTTIMLVGMLIVLFIAVWLPCCVSDIVFPLLFIKPGQEYKYTHHH